MDKQLVAQLEAALSDVLDRDVSGLTEGTRLLDDLHLDSTSVMETLMFLEDSLGIVVDPENLDMADFLTVGTLTAYLARVKPEPHLQDQ